MSLLTILKVFLVSGSAYYIIKIFSFVRQKIGKKCSAEDTTLI